MCDLSTNKKMKITSSGGQASYPAIYSNRVVYSIVRNGNEDIYMYDVSTKKETQITPTNGLLSDPAIYGNRIVWKDFRSGNVSDIYMYDLSTKTETRITTNGEAYAPAIYENRIVWQYDGNIYMGTVPQPKLPVAAFSASPRSGKAPLKVQFTDKSANSPTSWKWSFGDKTYSTQKNPVHKYSKAGKYTVSLTVKNANGSNTKTMCGYVVAKK